MPASVIAWVPAIESAPGRISVPASPSDLPNCNGLALLLVKVWALFTSTTMVLTLLEALPFGAL